MRLPGARADMSVLGQRVGGTGSYTDASVGRQLRDVAARRRLRRAPDSNT
jgi:hypothetical protein